MTGVQTCALPICFPVTIGFVAEGARVGIVGIGLVTGTSSSDSHGTEGVAKVDTGVTGQARGGYFISTDTHEGGNNVGVWTKASGGTVNYGVFSYGTDYSFYGDEGKIYNEDQVLIGSDANLTDFANAKAIISLADSGHTNSYRNAVVAETTVTGSTLACAVYGYAGANDAADTAFATGGYFRAQTAHAGANAGIQAYGTDGTINYGGFLAAYANGAGNGYGVKGECYVNASSDTGIAYGGYFQSDRTHVGGLNIGVYATATNGATNHGVYSSATDYSFYGEEGKIYNEDFVLFGTNANNTDFTRAQLVSSTGNTGDTNTAFIGAVGEAVASNGVANAMGLRGIATTNGANASFGVVGRGYVGATADTGIAYGGYFYATTTHAGANNIGIYANASGGTENFDFYGASGNTYSSGLKTKENSGTLADDATIALPTGVAGILQVWTEAEYGQVYVTTAGVVTLIAGSANFAITDSDTDLCVYDGGSGAVIKNRLGSSKTVRYSYKYS